MPLPRFAKAKAPLLAGLLIASYAASAYASLNFLRIPQGMAAIYLSNAFLLSGLLLLSGPWRWVCLIGCMVACATVVGARGGDYHPVYAIGTGVIAGIACSTGAFLGRRVLPQPSLKNLRQAILILALVIIPSSFVSGLLSATWMHLQLGRPMFPALLQWFMASVVGTSMVLPTLLILGTRSTTPRPRRSAWELAALALLVGAVVAIPYLGFYYFALVLAFPTANLLALRIGPRATALTMTIVNLSTFVYPLITHSALVHRVSPTFAATMVMGLQIYTIVIFYNALLTALAIDQQARTKRQLERRTAMARAARADALQASRAKTEFLATMSHEVRTPLNSILGFAHLLGRRGDLAGEARHQLGMIQTAGESLLTLVDDLLDFSKVEAGKLVLDPRPASLRSVTEEALGIVTPAATAKGLQVSFAANGAQGLHLFDDQRLRQVLLNFLNNAVKFTPRGRIDVRLDVRAVDGGEGDTAGQIDVSRISVSDTGVGIAREALPRLFQRFTQADSSISRSYGGTGLGLSISKGLAERMGGTVGVESQAGQGSTFWVEVPLPRAEAAEAAAPAGDEAAEVAAHVLLVDDNAANRELGANILRVLGCTVETASDGQEAIDAAAARPFDLILMDVHMPGMDGLAATRAIRQLAGPAARVPILAMTADVLPEQMDRCRAAGMVDHVTKPINVERLYERLVYWLSRDAGDAAGEAGDEAAA